MASAVLHIALQAWITQRYEDRRIDKNGVSLLTQSPVISEGAAGEPLPTTQTQYNLHGSIGPHRGIPRVAMRGVKSKGVGPNCWLSHIAVSLEIDAVLLKVRVWHHAEKQ
ncbi:hypothetical protein NDU88_005373 [Pleurodeles waltl]|uniref:Uncharacterized protein n=1 Tax=Pleurodeles waltl TaxID=8319 RepID=A0AAV7N116_PLEWA|nr:hypothetical protein NDU88_005373 [Pleurodeles waltl]